MAIEKGSLWSTSSHSSCYATFRSRLKPFLTVLKKSLSTLPTTGLLSISNMAPLLYKYIFLNCYSVHTYYKTTKAISSTTTEKYCDPIQIFQSLRVIPCFLLKEYFIFLKYTLYLNVNHNSCKRVKEI